MNYELIEWIVFSPPQLNEPQEGKTTLTITCTTGVVGDSYGFTKNDNFDMVVDNDKTIDQITVEITQACQNYIATNYPNT